MIIALLRRFIISPLREAERRPCRSVRPAIRERAFIKPLEARIAPAAVTVETLMSDPDPVTVMTDGTGHFSGEFATAPAAGSAIALTVRIGAGTSEFAENATV